MMDDSAIESLWEEKLIALWYLRDDQLPIYDLLLREKNPFIECARRYGKTTTILCRVLEMLLTNPGWVGLWCEPDKNQAREIVKPEVTKLFESAPTFMRPVWNTEDSYYWFPSTGSKDTASKLKLRGVNHDRGDSARGPAAHFIVADEFGTWKDPDYIVQSALRPQLQTTNGPFIFAGTPPEDLGHAYYDHKGWAIQEGRFIQRLIHDNVSLTPERIEELKKEAGGEHTPAWQREYLCKPVSNPERLVVPEYQEEQVDVPDDYARPECFDTYVGLDLGLNDKTAGLFAYIDFLKRELVIDHEWVMNGKNTKEITDALKSREHELWGTKPMFARWGDNELQQLHDMNTLHQYVVNPTRKDDKLAALNELRLLFSQGRIKIKKRCESLRYQLKVGLWNDRRTDFQRGEKTGHLDAIDALVYLHRNLSWHHNPYPLYGSSVTQMTHFLPEQMFGSSGQTADEKSLAAALGSFGG